MLTTEVKAPTKKQIELARKLGIEGAESLSRRELAKAIEAKLKEQKKEKEEVREDVEIEREKEEVVEVERDEIYEFYGHTNIQNPIIIQIPIPENRNTFKLMKRKKMYQNSPYLFQEFLSFLKRIGAKKVGENIVIKTGSNESLFSPAYVISTLENFFINFTWRYAN